MALAPSGCHYGCWRVFDNVVNGCESYHCRRRLCPTVTSAIVCVCVYLYAVSRADPIVAVVLLVSLKLICFGGVYETNQLLTTTLTKSRVTYHPGFWDQKFSFCRKSKTIK